MYVLFLFKSSSDNSTTRVVVNTSGPATEDGCSSSIEFILLLQTKNDSFGFCDFVAKTLIFFVSFGPVAGLKFFTLFPSKRESYFYNKTSLLYRETLTLGMAFVLNAFFHDSFSSLEDSRISWSAPNCVFSLD